VSAPEDLLAGLDPQQREVATAPPGLLCVLAGAGTGKTRAITHRIAYQVACGVWSASGVLAVTFTARAAGEMRGRLRTLGVAGVQARTFHSAALRQLGYFWPQVVGGDLPAVRPSKVALVVEAARGLRLTLGGTDARDVASEIEWAKSTRLAPDAYPAAAAAAGRPGAAGMDLAVLGRLYAGYEAVKTDRGVIDFEDVLLLTAAVLEERADVAATVRAQYRAFVVDEYQDVTPAQQALLDAWRGERDDLTVVGDASQTIYSFTGASPRLLLDLARPGSGARVVRLVRDYRSTPQVVDVANKVLAQASGPFAAAALELVAQRPAGPAPTMTTYPDEPAEAAGVASAARAIIAAGTPAREVAVLVRTNGQSEALEAAMADAGVAYVVRGGTRFFERPEVRQALLALRAAARAGDDAPHDAPSLPAQVAAVLGGAGYTDTAPGGTGAARERWESLAALVALAEELADADPTADLAGLVAELGERAAAQHAPAVDGVTIATFHAAKGLEWDAVFLVGLTDGTLPITYATTAEQVEEERRLLYVGVTRAREHLALSFATARSPGGRGSRRRSRFLDGVFAADPTQAARSASPRRRRGGVLPTVCAGCHAPLVTAADRTRGRCADCPPGYDESVFAALRAWRLERARTDSVPAFVVFSDATLEALAAARPASVAQLAGVSGVGPAKLARYGEEVLAVLAAAG